jgi:hypothetical protein
MKAQDGTPKIPKPRSEGVKLEKPRAVWVLNVACSILTLGVLGVAGLGVHWALGVVELRS